MFACTLSLLRTIYRAFSLTWPAYQCKLIETKESLYGVCFERQYGRRFDCFGTPVLLAAMTSCENAPNNEKPSLLRKLKRPLVHIHSHSLMQAPLRAVYMIPEWLLSRYHIGSTVRFVLHSHDKTEWLSMVFAYSCGSRLRLQDLRFSIRNEVCFQNEIPYKNENFFSNENRNGLICGEKHDFVRVSSEQMQRNMWRRNDPVSEWKSLRYQVNSPLNCCRGQCNEYLPEYNMVDGMYEELVVGAIAKK